MSGGIVIPSDRTTRQPARGYCLNPECLEDSTASRFEFDVEDDRFCCPKCGGREKPMVGLLVLTHLLVRSPEGPIRGATGRFKLACHHSRAYLATITNMEAATGDPRIANCPGCMEAARKLGIKIPSGMELLAKQD